MAFLNDGNRPIIVTSVSRSIDRVTDSDRERVATAISPSGDFGPRRLGNIYEADRYFREREDNLARLQLSCEPSDFEGYMSWQRFELEDNRPVVARPLIVKPGEMLSVGRVRFEGGWMAVQPSGTGWNETGFYRSCLRIDYLKSDGTAGLRLIPANVISDVLISGVAFRATEKDQPDHLQSTYNLIREPREIVQ